MSKHIAKMAIALCIAVALLLSVTPIAMADETQTWYLDSETTTPARMEKTGSPGDNGQTGSVPIGAGGNENWIADQAAEVDVTFPSGSWIVSLVTDINDDWKDFCVATIGAWNGSAFSAFATTNIVTASWAGHILRIEFQTASATVYTGDYLALKIENKDDSSHTVYTDDTVGGSFLTSPVTDPGYPVAELVSGILFGLGILGLGGYYIKSRRHKSLA